MANLLTWILFGTLSGWILALLLTTERKLTGRFVIMGILGALVAGSILQVIGHDSINHFNDFGVLAAVAGAIIALTTLKIIDA
jgi:uncharacterized membrane protein YeaQ/YmgE (transglycosylase-associated protein family)